MPTSKRERKRAGQKARQEAAAAARRKREQRRRLVGVAVVVGLVALSAVALGLAGGGDDGTEVASEGRCPAADGSATRRQRFSEPPPMCIDEDKTYKAEVETTKGTFEITLDARRAPKTVNNFVVLARYHYYDGVTFHRIIPDFVVQGGDPEGTGAGGPGYRFEDELPDPGDYEAGSVAMANSGPNTNGSQFFIVTSAKGAETLVQAVAGQARYSLFGRITAGMDVVKDIEAVGTPDGTPTEEVKMETVTITEG